MMKGNLFLAITIIFFILTSCQHELEYNPFEISENGMPRYLAKVIEASYSKSGPDQTEYINDLFSNPVFDDDGKLLSAYVNFIGEHANNTYTYEQNKIIVKSFTRDNETYLSEYTLDNNHIISCGVSSSRSNNQYYYSYSYNSDNCLKTINVNMDDTSFIITINWNKGNIESVKVLYKSGFSSIYSYEYSHNKAYTPIFPSFWISCFEIGGVYGVDELLSCQGFFGKNIPNDLITKEYFNGNLSREFKYSLDFKGCIVEVLDINSKRNTILRKYTLEWR